MKLGYIGLGKMGFNMVERLLEKGHDVSVFDTNSETVGKIAAKGASGFNSVAGVVKSLDAPRIVWLMVPHQVVDGVLSELVPLLSGGDIVIDGGNSPYKETIRRSGELASKNIFYTDCGTSGGPAGARDGACLMIGGREDVFKKLEPLFKDIAAADAYGYFGKSGAGHFVKMVHNGIEYGMMQAIAEGFEVMKKSDFALNLSDVSDVYNHKSVIESRLIGWLKSAYGQYSEELNGVSGSPKHSGEGLWTVEAAREFGVHVPIIEGALKFREESQARPSYAGQVVSALRNQFGGHDVKK